MNVFKTVSGYMFGDNPSAKSDLTVDRGEFYGRLKSTKNPVMLFRDSVLSVKKTQYEFQFELVVTRAFEDGELELELENEDDIDEERAFLIDEAMGFKISKVNTELGKAHNFSWISLDSRNQERLYEFIVLFNDLSEEKASGFHNYIIGCIYERKNNLPRENATLGDMSALAEELSRIQINEKTTTKSGTKSDKETSNDLKKNPSDRTPTDDFKFHFFDHSGERKEIRTSKPTYTAEVNLKIYDNEVSDFCLKNINVLVSICQEIADAYNYWLIISKNNESVIFSQRILPEMNPTFNNGAREFIWNYKYQYVIQSWLIEFLTLKEGIEFKAIFTQVFYETINRVKHEKVKKEEMDYYGEAFEDMDYEEIVAESEDECEYESMEDEPCENNTSSEWPKEDTNSELAVGYKHNRSFVVRGNKIGVFKHSSYDQIVNDSIINNVSDSKGKNFNPNKVMLHDQDSALVLMNPQDQHKLYNMDLERGKVVEEWKVHDDIPCIGIASSSKYSQMTPEKSLIGFGSNALYRIDPRINKVNKLVDSEMKQYSTKQGFVCAITTPKGEIAVASEKGEIKLYDKLGIKAKTALPAMGDIILGLDVSNDGRYLLATCKTYLLLIDVQIQSDPEKRLGFTKSFPKAEKPLPKRLQLKPDDVTRLNQPISFTPARFNAGEDSLESHIVTSTGPFVVIWNFRRVKLNNLTSYSVRKYKENVVSNNFLYNQTRSLIVTTPNDVSVATQNQFCTPKEYAKKLRSKSSIVDSPY